MAKARWPWLLAAVVLFAAAAWLMSRDDPQTARSKSRELKLPRHSAADFKRTQARRTWAAPEQPAATGLTPAPPLRDPVLVALPSSAQTGAMVLEANALRHSPVGQLLLDCLLARDGGKLLEEIRTRTGVDPLEELDRVAVSDEVVVLSGHFANAKLEEFLGTSGRPHGRRGTVYEPRTPDGVTVPDLAFGAWGEQLLVMAGSEQEVRAVLDRLEGGGTGGHPPMIDEAQAFGDIYGVLTTSALRGLVPEQYAGLLSRLEAISDRVGLHVDASRDVGIVADLRSDATGDAVDLGKSVGAALALARLAAQAEGQSELAELLEFARVVPNEGGFRLELGLPLEVLQRHLEKTCGAAQPLDAPAP
jgi:hypothetical protein